MNHTLWVEALQDVVRMCTHPQKLFQWQLSVPQPNDWPPALAPEAPGDLDLKHPHAGWH